MRHAEAESWSPLGDDFSRALSAVGNRHASLASSWAFKTLAPPDTIVCSPARRTRETLAPFLARWPRTPGSTDYTDSIYNASLDQLLELVEDVFSYSERLMLVGHNPGVTSLLYSVLHAEHAAGIKSMGAGTLAVVGFPAGFRRHAGSGTLHHLKRPLDFSLD